MSGTTFRNELPNIKLNKLSAKKIFKGLDKVACRSEGGKWVKGSCVFKEGEVKNYGKPNESYNPYKIRKQRKKHPGTGDWYPEKG